MSRQPYGAGQARSSEGTWPPIRDAASPLQVVLADDHRMFRSFVTGVLIDHYADLLTVVATCSISVLGSVWAQYQPMLVLLDIGLPGMTGLGQIAELRAAGFRGWVIVLSMEDDPPYVTAALAAGADALLGKGNLNTTLRPTIVRLCHGTLPVTQAILS